MLFEFHTCECSMTGTPSTGPVSDVLFRQAYVAAYDRQKRHPAWVSDLASVSDQYLDKLN